MDECPAARAGGQSGLQNHHRSTGAATVEVKIQPVASKSGRVLRSALRSGAVPRRILGDWDGVGEVDGYALPVTVKNSRSELITELTQPLQAACG